MITFNKIKDFLRQCNLDCVFRSERFDLWDNVLEKISDVPTCYLSHLVSYQSTVFRNISGSNLELSLIIFNDRRPCAVWSLFIDPAKSQPLKSINDQFGGIVIPPLFVDGINKKSERRILKNCIKFLNFVLNELDCEYFLGSELSAQTQITQWQQLLMENGAKFERINYELYLDLSRPLEQIRKSIRKSYKPLISQGLNNWTVQVDAELCPKNWQQFQSLHKKVAGRITRPLDSWEIQKGAINNGNAFLVGVYSKTGSMVGGSLFDMSRNEVNYSVATYDKSLHDQPLGHLVQYHAILHMQAIDKTRYYIGSRFYKAESELVTPKQVNISSFKAGFASTLLPRMTYKMIYEQG
jgi:FemAB family protein